MKKRLLQVKIHIIKDDFKEGSKYLKDAIVDIDAKTHNLSCGASFGNFIKQIDFSNGRVRVMADDSFENEVNWLSEFADSVITFCETDELFTEDTYKRLLTLFKAKEFKDLDKVLDTMKNTLSNQIYACAGKIKK